VVPSKFRLKLPAVWVSTVVWMVAASPVFATFHFMQIEQVIGGVNGDTSAQAIQLRMRLAGQNLVSQSRIRVHDATGSNPILVLDLTTNVASGAAGRRVLIVSPNFSRYTSPAVVPDFTMTSLIPDSYMAAGSLTFEDDVGTILWRLSWGGAGYTGSTTGSMTNDADGNFGPPVPGALPTTTHQALRFTGTAGALSTNNAAQYAVTAGDATFTNNATTAFTVADAVCLTEPGDVGEDGCRDALELQGFADCLIGGQLGTIACDCADADENGMLDEDDIAALVSQLLGAVPCV